MPELPEVTLFKDVFEKNAFNKPVKEAEASDPRILEDNAADITGKIQGDAFVKVERIGKHLLAETSSGWLIGFHFGMTGSLAALASGDELPRFTSFVFHFDDGSALAFVCSRKLGRIGLYTSREAFVEEKDLGPDALSLDFETFYEKMQHKKGSLKNILMDQSFLSGIGNLYSDEVLFQGGWHPKSKTDGWGREDYRKLYDIIQKVLNDVIEAQADSEKLPDGYLLPYREEGAVFEGCPGGVQRIKIGGRSAYICPDRQALP